MSTNNHSTVDMQPSSASSELERTSFLSMGRKVKNYSTYGTLVVFCVFVILILFKVDGAEKLLLCTNEFMKTMSNIKYNNSFV